MRVWDLGIMKINHHGKGCVTTTHAVGYNMPVPFKCLLADVTAKTVSEEYTPLHLVARFIPPKTTHSTEGTCVKTTYSTEGGRVVPDADDSSEDTNTVINYLKQCKGVDVSLITMLL